MSRISRRNVMKQGAALAVSSALVPFDLLGWAKAWAQAAPWKPEAGAQLSMLRWKYFVQSEDDAFIALLDAFTKATGVKVAVSRRSRGRAAQGLRRRQHRHRAGPVLGLYSLPHLFPQKCLDVSDVATYLGGKYGGWTDSAVIYGKGTGNIWIDIPICYTGILLNYRTSSLTKAGMSKFPVTTAEFLEYAKATKRNNTPGGLALGHASGDGNAWVHWCLWAHGGNLVDKSDKIIINSPETEAALVYAKQLYENMIPGVVRGTTRRITRLSWQAKSTGPAMASRFTPQRRRTRRRRRSPRT